MASIAQRRHALQAADDLLTELDIDQEAPVDVFDIIDRLGLWLTFNRLTSLLGATLPKGTGGIMLTTQRGPAVQRYTAAHEIGHWILDFNEPAFDTQDDIFIPTGDREHLAQLFAGQLLLPPPLVFETCARHGITSDANASATGVYLAARDMGASYEAAVRQLANLEMIGRSTRDALLTRRPMQIKEDLCHGHRPRGAVDVWPFDLSKTGTEVQVTEGDEVVVILPENRTTGYRWLTPFDIAERATRVPNPPPAPFAPEFVRAEAGPRRPAEPEAGATRSASDVRRSLTRVPGDTASRQLLPGGEDRAEDADPTSGGSDGDEELSGLATVDETRSATDPNPASFEEVDDRFTAGWAQIRPSRTRAVRRVIAGRRDLSLPESVRGLLTPAETGPSGDPSAPRSTEVQLSAIPAAATGERILALRSRGEGTLGVSLFYTAPLDPTAPISATFDLAIRVAVTPEERQRRVLLESVVASLSVLDGPDDSDTSTVTDNDH